MLELVIMLLERINFVWITFFDIPTETVKAIVETNFIGFFMVVSNFIQFMLENGGSIVGCISYIHLVKTRNEAEAVGIS